MAKKLLPLALHEVDKIIHGAVLTQADFDLINSKIDKTSLIFIKNRAKAILNKKSVKQDIALIDWLNFSFNEMHMPYSIVTSSYDDTFDDKPIGQHDLGLMQELSFILDSILGFGITQIRKTGAMFYERSYELGNGYGMVCHGGNNQTILVSINATGLSFAKEGWQSQIYKFIGEMLATITRIDIAHDSFEPEYLKLDNMVEVYKKGGFNNGLRLPLISQVGDWVGENKKGRTLYIGARANGLFARIYEKGKQLQSEDAPNWVRLEVEFKSSDRFIPHQALLVPHKYLAGAYPCCKFLFEEQSRISTIKREVNADIDHRTTWAKRQLGSVIHLLSELGHTDTEIIHKLRKQSLPKKFEQKFIQDTDLVALHQPTRVVLPPF